jgi:hypothetical protein
MDLEKSRAELARKLERSPQCGVALCWLPARIVIITPEVGELHGCTFQHTILAVGQAVAARAAARLN